MNTLLNHLYRLLHPKQTARIARRLKEIEAQ